MMLRFRVLLLRGFELRGRQMLRTDRVVSNGRDVTSVQLAVVMEIQAGRRSRGSEDAPDR